MRKASIYHRDFQALWKNLLKIFYMYKTEKASVRQDRLSVTVASEISKVVGLERRRRKNYKEVAGSLNQINLLLFKCEVRLSKYWFVIENYVTQQKNVIGRLHSATQNLIGKFFYVIQNGI